VLFRSWWTVAPVEGRACASARKSPSRSGIHSTRSANARSEITCQSPTSRCSHSASCALRLPCFSINSPIVDTHQPYCSQLQGRAHLDSMVLIQFSESDCESATHRPRWGTQEGPALPGGCEEAMTPPSERQHTSERQSRFDRVCRLLRVK